jgi:hypothetical protein
LETTEEQHPKIARLGKIGKTICLEPSCRCSSTPSRRQKNRGKERYGDDASPCQFFLLFAGGHAIFVVVCTTSPTRIFHGDLQSRVQQRPLARLRFHGGGLVSVVDGARTPRGFLAWLPSACGGSVEFDATAPSTGFTGGMRCARPRSPAAAHAGAQPRSRDESPAALRLRGASNGVAPGTRLPGDSSDEEVRGWSSSVGR